jgi:response regulator RpfG family c-di-GMP phosphodiesterase
LPDIDGIAVTKKIRSLADPVKAKIPIIALTGHAAGDQHEACLAAGMNAVLTKPAQSYELQLVLQRWVWFKDPEGETFNPSHLAVIDWDESLGYFNNNSEALHEILQMMVEDMKTTRKTLADCYAKHDEETLRAELHRCLGGVAYLKLPRLEYALKLFQSAIRVDKKDPQLSESAYLDLDDAIDEFLKTFNE